MTRPVAVLRPEPGGAETAARLAAEGLAVIRLPLFVVRPVAWQPPMAPHDALILTSANAVRHGGPGLDRLTALPVHAVGEATAAAARAAGFDVVATGTEGAEALRDAAARGGVERALYLAGRAHRLDVGGPVASVRIVYDSAVVPVEGSEVRKLRGAVALVHSARAGARLSELVGESDRAEIALAGISAAAMDAAGRGWQARAVADAPDDMALIAAARTLAD